jgi:heat shock transcription factor
MAQPMNGYGAAVGAQLSDDQFLQWGQTAQPPNPYTDPATYQSQSMNSMPPSTAQSSNQLTRRPGNRIATRARQPDNTANNMYLDGVGGSNENPTQQQVDSAWGDDLEELERRAAVAKKEAQGKRKQIPPFVQKLNR